MYCTHDNNQNLATEVGDLGRGNELSIEECLIQLLLLLRQELGQTDAENIRIRCRFTHQNLAAAIGITRVTVTRLLKEFQAKHWLYFDGDRHLIITKKLSPKLSLTQ